MKKIYHKLSYWMFFGLMGGIFPLLFFMFAWWGSIGRVNDEKIIVIAFIGFLWGILLDFLVLNRIMEKLFNYPLWLMAFVFLFWSIFIDWFFVGLPLFNLFLAIPAGIYMGTRFQGNKIDSLKKIKKGTISFTTLVMFLLILLAVLQIVGTKKLSQIKPITYIVIFLVGAVLVYSQIFLTNHYFEKHVKIMEHNIQSS